jgi:magnesium transporter
VLIAGIYGMNFRFMPELGWKFGYPFALSLMVIISTALILYFRRRKWL